MDLSKHTANVPMSDYHEMIESTQMKQWVNILLKSRLNSALRAIKSGATDKDAFQGEKLAIIKEFKDHGIDIELIASQSSGSSLDRVNPNWAIKVIK